MEIKSRAAFKVVVVGGCWSSLKRLFQYWVELFPFRGRAQCANRAEPPAPSRLASPKGAKPDSAAEALSESPSRGSLNFISFIAAIARTIKLLIKLLIIELLILLFCVKKWKDYGGGSWSDATSSSRHVSTVLLVGR